jgi:hypothetical protein
VSTLQIERFYAALVESGGKRRAGLAPKSVRNTHVVLGKALADAERLGLVARNTANLLVTADIGCVCVGPRS